MAQKILKIGSSVGVTIPKKSLQDLGLKPGDNVEVRVEGENIIIQGPVKKATSRQKKVAKLTFDFINRHRKDLEALAKE
ncbi:hypothetical protein A3B18_02915 [Candidatus Giovannonibacteria bacterium RIFCSPLOWO2_01_FULL_46_13]|uniref:SpoVT-AbrB domain-containing protein n=1 Tax=Candidatus Giovannonibacteria bacterium RIFCSPLOWO2_01_FULL_46_13 TaxID=1798352 RepID=A0A1F5X2Y8_9BACT|nr:MAG: hypothetical protein A3B18_02915 [Candidatus Giovannonibacteria bacterium RIFCSPLOWO2_01_FULL_46_13]